MSLGIEDPLIQTDRVGSGVEKIEVLESLSHPEALHLVKLRGVDLCDVLYGGVSIIGRCGFDDGLEHVPALVLPCRVAGYTVHVPY